MEELLNLVLLPIINWFKNFKSREFIKIIDSLEVVNNINHCQIKFNNNREKLSKRKGNNSLLTELIEYHEKINDDHSFNFNKSSTPNCSDSYRKKMIKDFEEYKKIISEYKNKIKD